MAKELALIFGPPKAERGKEMDKEGGYDGDIPADFRDHCEAAFEAIADKDSAKFCEEIWLAIKAYEETPHSENEEGEENGEESE
jgi:hypothetical protein